MYKIGFLKKSANELSPNHQFNGIDLMKFICAIFVCIIHIGPFASKVFGGSLLIYVNFALQQYICRMAVPFYFVSSGFLLFRKTDITHLNGDRIKNYCFKILRLLGTWSFLLVVGQNFQLWYLGALVLAVLVLCLFINQKMSLRGIAIISIIAYIIGLLGDSYYGLIEPLKNYYITKIFIVGYEMVFKHTRNGIFFGMPYVFMGMLFAQRKIVIRNTTAIIGMIVSLIIMFFEVFLLTYMSIPKDRNMYISLLPVTFFLFYIASHIELKNNSIYRRLCVVGILVFFMHQFVRYFVNILILKIGAMGVNIVALEFPITILLTIVLAVQIERVSQIEKFKWLRYIYS